MAQFIAAYPNEDACLNALFDEYRAAVPHCAKCGVVGARFYRVKNRRSFACVHCRHQIYPTAGTIYHKTTTPLTSWFFAIYLFSTSRNGVSALELQRHIGVTYKTAWRMCKQIRSTMKQDPRKLRGVVEADEAYIGGRRRSSNRFSNKTPLLGVVQRNGRVRVLVTDSASATTALPFLRGAIAKNVTLITDESRIYFRAKQDFSHTTVNHSKGDYVRDSIYTNTLEGFWGILKPSLDGTYRSVSKQHLQLYVDEFAWRYNNRGQQLYPLLWRSAVMQCQRAPNKH